jgi:hypothetical protein
MSQSVSEQTILFSILFLLGIFILLAAAITLFFKFVIKLKWLTSICIAVLLLTVLSILGVWTHATGLLHAGFLLLPPAFVCALILVIQFFRWLFSTSAAQSAVNPEERSRILKLVEDSKITAADGKELLDAMGKSSALRGEEKFSRIDFAILAGVGLVILGFFLPWVYIRLPNMSSFGIFNTNSAYQAGYNTGAIGWTIFIIAIASAIPVFVTPRNLLYKISMLQIFLTIIRLVLVISVMVQVAHNHLGVGLVFCLLGFITAFIASIAKLKSLAA